MQGRPRGASRRAAGARRDRGGMADLRVVLELDRGTDAVPCGRLLAGGRDGVRFAGWIELADALERVLVAAAPRRAGPAGLSGGEGAD